MAMQKGARVRQVSPVIEGEIVDRRFDDAADGMQYLVSYEADGETHSRWFAEREVEEVTQ